jgi:hypothetical protein
MNLKHFGIRFVPAAFLSIAGVMSLAAPSQALVINGGFESGLTGWTTTGDVRQVGSFNGNFGPFNPSQGSFQALINTGSENPADLPAGYAVPTTDADTLETFLSLNPGDLGVDVPLTTAGSGLVQTFTLASAGTLSFNWGYRGESTFLDRPFWVLNSGLNLLPIGSAPGGDTGGSTSFGLGPGTYTLGFGIVNVNDSNGPSQLLIDNVSFTEGNNNNNDIPVPPQFLATALGAGIGALKLRRQKARAEA